MWCKLALAATATALAPTATSRRRFVAGAAGAVVAAPLAGANAADVNKLNRKLDKLGLPPVDKLPDGFSPVLSSVNQEQSLFVQFVRPNDWLVVQPSVNTNGAAPARQIRRRASRLDGAAAAGRRPRPRRPDAAVFVESRTRAPLHG